MGAGAPAADVNRIPAQLPSCALPFSGEASATRLAVLCFIDPHAGASHT